MKVRAFTCAYNEADILPWTVRHMVDQGIEPYLIDNWSTDGTWEMDLPFVGKERFPADGPSKTYDWFNLLRRVEELAMQPGFDWAIHWDADEIRRSPWPELCLRDAIKVVEMDGYNAIDHHVFLFPPTDNGYEGDPENYFRHYAEEHHELRNYHIKAWKNTGKRVDLAGSGGHHVSFPDRRVHPQRFILKHYPIRSQEHGEKKVFGERQPRWNNQERFERGWHVQYNGLSKGHNFLVPVNKLTRWPTL